MTVPVTPPATIRPARHRAWLRLALFALMNLVLIPVYVVAVGPMRRLRPWLQRLYCRLINRLLGLRLAVSGQPCGAGPVLFVANHVSWWDPILLIVLDEALGGLGWAVMDSRNLRDVPFLGWVGALPLDRSSHDRSRECLQSCAALMTRPGRAMWIFPQGRQRPAHLRPLDLKHGVQTLHDHAPVDVVAVSLDYVFLERDRPAAVVRFAPPRPGAAVGGGALLPAIEQDLLDGLAVIDAAATEATDGGRARRHPDDPLPGFVALVAPRGFGTPNGAGGRLLRLFDRRTRRG